MSVEACSCSDSSTIQNFGGLGDCLDGVGVPVNAILLADDKVDGSINGIDTVNDTLNAAFFNGKFKDPEVSDRWLFLEGLEDFDSPPIDPTVEDFASGKTVKISDNPKEVTFFIVTPEAYKLAAKIKASECRSLSIMYNDDLDNLVGDLQGTTFKGRKIQNGSLDVQVIDATFTTAARVQVKFKYDRKALESRVDYIKDSAISGFTVSTDATALIDVDITYGAATTTSVTFSLANDFGGIGERVPAGGLTTSELEVFNVTDTVVEGLSSLVETSLGTYVATYTTPVTSSDVIEVRGASEVYVQLDYDLKAIDGVTVTTA